MSDLNQHSESETVASGVATSAAPGSVTRLSNEEITETLMILDGADRPAKVAALRTIQAHPAEFIPILLASMDEAVAECVAGEDPNMFAFFAQFLLTEFREVRAVPPILKILHQPGDIADLIFGDTVTEGLAWMISVLIRPDQIDWLDQLIRDRNSEDFNRLVGIRCYQELFLARQLTREDVVARLIPLFRESMAKPDLTTAHLTEALLELGATEVEDELRIALQFPEVRGYLDEFNMEEVLGRTSQEIEADLREFALDGFTDTVEVLLKWHNVLKDEPHSSVDEWDDDFDDESDVDDFLPPGEMPIWKTPHIKAAISKILSGESIDERNLFPSNESVEPDVAPDGYEYVVAPIRYRAPLVGRNDPCPCGTGKKFKKCCLNKNG